MRYAIALAALLAALLTSNAFGGTARSLPHLTLHRLWVHSISPNADSAPVYLAKPRGHQGAIVYVLAGNNRDNCSPGDPVTRAALYAIDVASGRTLWTRSTSGPSRCTTAGPVVDPSHAWVYAPGLDGDLHRYSAGSGKETRGHGWPVRITLMPDVEKIAATPTIHGGYLYVTTSGFIGDQGHYEGHLVAIKLSNAGVHVFNSLCSNITQLLGPTPGRPNYCPAVQSGLFGRGQGVTDPVNGDVYVVSGNGPWNGKTNWGDSILKLDPSGARLIDSYTPTDQSYLASNDLDLGSSGPAILPAVTASGRAYHFLVQAGKGPASPGTDGAVLRLLNRDDLSGRHALGQLGGDLQNIAAPGGSEVLTAPAVWRSGGHDWVFYANDSGVAAYRLDGGNPWRLDRVWSSPQGGTTPVVANRVLYVAHDREVDAYRASDGTVLAKLTGIGGIHWEYPLIRNHLLFIADQSGKVYAERVS